METPDQMQERWAKAIAEAGVKTEEQMRESEVPTPSSHFELAGYVDALVNRPHDYGTCCYAMSMAAIAAFNYVASKLGVTGFQESCADLDIIRRTRGLKHGFMILNGNDVLYPQYDLVEKAAEFVAERRKALAGEAKKLLKESGKYAAESVRNHWQELAK